MITPTFSSLMLHAETGEETSQQEITDDNTKPLGKVSLPPQVVNYSDPYMHIYSAAQKKNVTVTTFFDNWTYGNGIVDWVQRYGYSTTKVPNPYQGHGGTDAVGGFRSPIYAVVGGHAEVLANNGTAGNEIIITNGDYRYRYLHLDTFKIVSGAISAGQLIGTEGGSGDYDPHLHFETQHYKDGRWNKIDSYNILQGKDLPAQRQIAANLEEFTIKQDSIKVKGWHVDEWLVGAEPWYIFVIDANTGLEYTRKRVAPQHRPDVAAAYPKCKAAAYSGFDLEIPITGNMRGKNLKIVSRFSGDEMGNITASERIFDHVQNERKTGAHLSQFDILHSTIKLKGWHVDSWLMGAESLFIFIIDAQTGQEYFRQRVSPLYTAGFPYVKTAVYSGFELEAPITGEMKGKSLKIMSRFVHDTAGNQGVSEFTFPHIKTISTAQQTAGHLDKFDILHSTIKLKGWHADSWLMGAEPLFIFIIDANTGQEYFRQRVTPLYRSDVAAAYPQIKNAAYSGFELEVPITNEMKGKSLKIMSRFVHDNVGNQGVSQVTFPHIKTISTAQQTIGHLNQFDILHSTIKLRGWHADSWLMGAKPLFIFIIDANTGQEYFRQRVTPLYRSDVAVAYPQIKNAAYSGFELEVPITNEMKGKSLKIMSRFVHDNAGNQGVSQVTFTHVKKA